MAFADQDLTQRNFQALSEGLKDIRQLYADTRTEVVQLRNNISSLINDIHSLKVQNGMMLAKFHGTGSTA